MSRNIGRRDFLKAAGLSAGLASPLASLAQPKTNVKIGHTGMATIAKTYLEKQGLALRSL